MLMTIKEVETRTGLARANIRYYEEQGFFSADRGENGYRNYTGRDVDLLLKVKLLRQLGFSLEDIRDLQRGDRDLGSALENRLSGLEKERRDMDRASRLCRELREDGVEFDTLNARLYLDRVFQGEEIIREDRAPKRVFHWRRYFARILDMRLWEALLCLCFPLSMELNILGAEGNRSGKVILGFLALLLMSVSEIFLLHRFGTTLGKALFGLKIVREDGGLLSLGEAARRTGCVAAVLGLIKLTGLFPEPLPSMVSLLACAWMYWTASHELPLPWEQEDQVYLDGSTKDTSFWERKHSWVRAAGYMLACLACLGLTIAGVYLGSLPPNRGPELTTAEFVENYNFYDMYERGNTLPRLMEDGTFRMRAKREYGWHFPWEDVTPPEFRFTEQDGAVTGVTIFREWESDGPLDHRYEPSRLEVLPSSQVRLSLLALGFDRHDAQQVFQAVIDGEGNLHQDFDGVRVDCETRFSGYRLYYREDIRENTLSGVEGEEQSYFVAFTIALT